MSHSDPTLEELRVLSALVNMCQQYLSGSFIDISHDFMSAGERAVEVLVSYGLLQRDPCGGTWTERGLFVGNLDEIDESTFPGIRQRYMAIKENRPLTTIPGMWKHLPNLTICSLKFWFRGFALERVPEISPRRGWLEPDRLDVVIQMSDIDGQARVQGELFTLGDLQRFRNDLAKIHERRRGAARLRGTKDSHKLRVSTEPDGTLSGEVTLNNINFHHSHTFELLFGAHTDIPKMVTSIDAVIERFKRR